MKIVIIGGGIGGLALNAILLKRGYETVLNERAVSFQPVGHGFMIHGEGLAAIERLGKPGDNRPLPGKPIDTFILMRPDGKEIKNLKMEAWQCAKRNDLISYLYECSDKSSIRFGRTFSHFLYDGDKAVAAVFENGEIEYGDLFVGADGSMSKVRKAIFGDITFTPVEIQEVLGFARFPEMASKFEGIFNKYQNYENGISFGYIPVSDDEFIWFTQYDVSLVKDTFPSNPQGENLYKFTKQLLADFPSVVVELIDRTDFKLAHVWNTRDFDPLHKFHSGNIVLIGDAAHVALPFTSAGTTNALMDAEQLVKSIEKEADLESAFNAYYDRRIQIISEHVNMGREIKNAFLNPSEISEEKIQVPLIRQIVKKPLPPLQPLIDILYFTDPICSTCWIIQPQLRKLKLNYGKKIRFSYIMSGLLPSWDNYERGKIKTPSDVIPYWDDASEKSGMPIDSSVWSENPVDSSYPASIAFKAAQLQNIDRAILFLRRINEIVFLQKGNIAQIDIIKQAAFDIGLDAARLVSDMETKAKKFFFDDLKLAQEKGITILPTFQFALNGEIKETLSGIQTYETFEEILLRILPDIQKEDYSFTPFELFDSYPSLTIQEFRFLTNTDDKEADNMINLMLQSGRIKAHKTPKGVIYFANHH